MSDQLARLRTVIVDDEPLARRLMVALLAEIPEVELVAQCSNGREAIQSIHDLEPDLVILDIQMPGFSGFDVIKELQADRMPLVIFCTAYQRYAVDAFDLHAVDYLLKPVDDGRLRRAVGRAMERIHVGNDPHQHKQPLVGAIEEIARKVAGRTDARHTDNTDREALAADRKIAIKDHDSTLLLDIDDIDWVDAAGDYMCVHANGATHIMRSTLKNLMSRLDPDKFKRIHRSTVVNLDRIVKATPLQKGEYILELDCDEQLKVSRNYRQSIKLFLSGR